MNEELCAAQGNTVLSIVNAKEDGESVWCRENQFVKATREIYTLQISTGITSNT